MTEQTTERAERVNRLKPRVYGFIESNGPVDHDTIMVAFDGLCDCCGETNERGEAVKEARMQLLDENRIVADVDWNYRVREADQ